MMPYACDLVIAEVCLCLWIFAKLFLWKWSCLLYRLLTEFLQVENISVYDFRVQRELKGFSGGYFPVSLPESSWS